MVHRHTCRRHIHTHMYTRVHTHTHENKNSEHPEALFTVRVAGSHDGSTPLSDVASRHLTGLEITALSWCQQYTDRLLSKQPVSQAGWTWMYSCPLHEPLSSRGEKTGQTPAHPVILCPVPSVITNAQHPILWQPGYHDNRSQSASPISQALWVGLFISRALYLHT